MTPPRGVIALLTAQALAFGVTLALLIVPANSLFLDAYGSEWLPATYIAVAIVGSAAAAFIARAARRTPLVRVASVSLGALALLYGASWTVLVGGGEWVSAVLLVLFPIALQAGFVFIGGQAGRLLDIRQMKELFPRVVTGFAVGFLLGGLLGVPLLALLGSTENLLIATTLFQVVFLALLLVTERRFPEVRAAQSADAPEVARPPLHALLAGLASLLLAYQVLSAMGSQVVDFLLFDRAAARYSGDDLTRFLSTYTALLNLADILFLALLAGPLMRRFGLKLGLVLNPAVVAGILGVMAVVAVGPPGAGSFALFALAGGLRIADIATTDGTTRTSINAAYQVVPVDERLAVQALVEGIGVPVAIGATGVFLLALEALDLGVGSVIVFGLVLSTIWTVVAVSVYRSYTGALADEVRRRPLVADDDAAFVPDDEPAVRALLRSDDARDVRLGLDLLAGAESPVAHVELRQLAAHADAEVRVRALRQLAAAGDAQAEVDRRQLAQLVDDGEISVRRAALEAVTRADAGDADLVQRVVAALDEPRLAGSAAAALRRLGDAAVPPLEAALARDDTPRRASLVRAAAAAAAERGIGIVRPALEDTDRTVVLESLEALDAAGCGGLVGPDVVEKVLQDASALAARAIAARETLDDESPLARALEDEVDLARRLVIAALALRHGDRVRQAVRVVEHAEGPRRALGVEALDVLLSREEAALALPLVRRDAGAQRQADWRPHEWVEDIARDPEAIWRSPWLASCATHAAAQLSSSN